MPHSTSLKSSFQTERISTLMALGPQISLLRKREMGQAHGIGSTSSIILWEQEGMWGPHQTGREKDQGGGWGRRESMEDQAS